MDGLHLRAVSRTQGNNRALTAGEVTPAGYVLDFEEVPVLVQAFRRMVRTLEFDVCEMAVTTYLTARAHGVAFTAIPVFLVRGFHHGAMVRPAGSFSSQEAPSTMGNSRAISAIITSATPSIPTLKLSPIAGIQSTRVSNW